MLKGTILSILVAASIINIECLRIGGRQKPNGTRRPTGGKPGTFPGIKQDIDTPKICEVGKQCPLGMNNPVCGSDGVTYGSPCELINAKCENSELSMASFGECGSGTEKSFVGRPNFDEQRKSGGQTPFGGMRPSRGQIPSGGHWAFGREKPSRGQRPLSGKIPNFGENRGINKMQYLDKKKPFGSFIKAILLNVDNIEKICELSTNCSGTYENQVCGSDGVTYNSICEFLAQKCEDKNTETRIEQFGACGEESERPHFKRPNKLDLICKKSKTCLDTMNKPVCGSNNETYDSFCEFLSEKCENKDLNTTLDHFGACGTEPEWPNKPNPERKRAMCERRYHHCYNRSSRFDFENHVLCGSDNVTYNSICEFKIAKCIDIFLTIAKKGECTEDQGNPEEYCVKCPVPRVRPSETTDEDGKDFAGRPDFRKPQGGRPQGRRPQGGRGEGGRLQGGRPELGKPGNGPREDRKPEFEMPHDNQLDGEKYGPHHGGRPGPHHGGRPGPHHSGRPGPHHGGRPGPHHGGRPGPHHGGRPEPHHGGRPRPHHGGRPGPHHGRRPGPHHGGRPGPHHGGKHHGGRRPEDFQVCGTDGLTYTSVCELKRTACLSRDFDLDVASFGPCSTQTPTTEAFFVDP